MDRLTLAVAGGVLVLVVAGLLAAGVQRGKTRPPDLSTPSGVVLAYALAEQRGDAETAWSLLATSAQARADHDRFLARAGNSTNQEAYLTTEDERIDGSGASVVLVQTYPGSTGIFGRGASFGNRTTVRLTHEADGWRITVPPDDYLLTALPPAPARP